MSVVVREERTEQRRLDIRTTQAVEIEVSCLTVDKHDLEGIGQGGSSINTGGQ